MQRLQVSAGNFTDKGRKPSNQDSQGFRIAQDALLQTKGIAAAIADGVSTSEYGAEASHACVYGFLVDYFSTPESWSVKKSAQQIFTALNGWLYRQVDEADRGHRGKVSTLSTIVFKSNTCHLFHIGDSRIYRLRQGNLEQLTIDHRNWVTPDKSYLSRAMGVDINLKIDYSRHALEVDDIYVLTTDGVHDYLADQQIAQTVLNSSKELDRAAELVVRQALQRNSHDNVSCLLLRVESLPSQDADEVFKQLTELPFPPELNQGMILDGYRIVRELHASNRSQLYLATDADTGLQVVLKTPSVNYQDDPAYIERFTMEEWVGRRLNNEHVLKVYQPTRRRRFLYHVTEYLDGMTLRQWIHDNKEPDLETVRNLVEQIARGLQSFHRQEMLHQDLKPENIIIGRDGTLKIVDFGSVKVAGIAEIDSPVFRSDLLGTKNYTAPEYLTTGPVNNAADIFSLGVITYEMLTGFLPYGQMSDNWGRQRLKRLPNNDALPYKPARDYQPTIPLWLDGMLKKSVTPDPAQRYQELSEFLFDLRTPNNSLVFSDQRSLLQRNPLLFWKGLSASLLVLVLIVSIYAFS